MAMEIVRVIDEAHDSEICSITYNRARREIYSAAEGDKVIRVWDARTGGLIRTQQGHKGMVTCLAYASNIRLLFSGSIDTTVGIWTDKGIHLQMAAVGGSVFSLAWDVKRRFLVVGGNSCINLFKVDTNEARKTSQAQRAVSSGLKDTSVLDSPQIIKRLFPPLKGPELCHTDVVRTIVITDAGKIITGGFDKNICMYEYEKLDKPKEAFQRIRKCHTAAIVSMAYDTYNNCILTGAIDGSMKVWSMEGRLLDKFENINDQPVTVAYVASTNTYWATGRFGRIAVYDPRAPANVTDYIKQANGLDRHKIEYVMAPPHTDMLVGASRQRELVIWQHNQFGAYRTLLRHEEWVESMIVVHTASTDSPTDEIFSCGADGKVLRWQLDVEQNCDIYQCIEEIPLHKKNIYCITYSEELDCLITGGEEGIVQIHYLNGVVPTFNDVPLPTTFHEHTLRVTGLALLRGLILASCSFDKSLRFGDLSTMKTVMVIVDAHDSPVQCLEYCPARRELATCGMCNKVKVWDVSKPRDAVRLSLTLDHAETEGGHGKKEAEAAEARAAGRSNMNWLTRSDLPNLPHASGLVLEAIMTAHRDVPEVTQVRWVLYRQCWITAADDDMIRLWSPEGTKLHQFAYTGGSVQCLFVDNINQMIVAAMLDKNAYVYDLNDPMPRARYNGHMDVIRSIAYIKECDCYLTASWDKSLRLWYRPSPERVSAAGQLNALGGDSQAYTLVDDDDDEATFVSNYEKLHPLEVPRALTEANAWQVLKAIGVLEDDKPKKGRKGKYIDLDAKDAPEEAKDLPGTLGAKLEDLGRQLLTEINTIATSRKDDDRASLASRITPNETAGRVRLPPITKSAMAASVRNSRQ